MPQEARTGLKSERRKGMVAELGVTMGNFVDQNPFPVQPPERKDQQPFNQPRPKLTAQKRSATAPPPFGTR